MKDAFEHQKKRGVVTVDLGEDLYGRLADYQKQNYGVSRTVVIRQALAFFLANAIHLCLTGKNNTATMEAGK